MAKNNTAARESQSELVNNSEVRAVEGKAEASTIPTAASIACYTGTAMSALFSMFYETEQKRMGDNGKLYRIDASLPEGVDDTGEVQDVQVWRYIQDQLTSVVCWKLEDLLYRCDEQVAGQRQQIKSAVRQLDSGRVEPSFIEAKADYLEKLLVQHSMLATAFEASRTAYFDLTGNEYETRASRAERRAVEATKPKSPMADRLAKLGV